MLVTIAAPAFAATTKAFFTDYNSSSGEVVATPTLSYATFVTNQGDRQLDINVTLKSALKNTTYYVWLVYAQLPTDTNPNPPISEPIPLGTLTTNTKGNWGGQNQQYNFEYIMPKGTYSVVLILSYGSDVDYLMTPWGGPTVRITGN